MVQFLNAIPWIQVIKSPLLYWIPALALLVAGGRALVLARQEPDQAKFAGAPMVGISLAFITLDVLLLSLLPVMGISFGPIQLSLFFLILLRSTCSLAWGIWLGLRARRSMHVVIPVRGGLVALTFFQAAITGLVVDGFYIEPFNLQVSQYQTGRVSAPAGDTFRIVHLSDLHVERLTKREDALLEDVRALDPDLILITGDFLNTSYLSDEQAVEDLRQLLGGLSAPYGVFAVNGSVETPDQVKEWLQPVGVKVLDDEIYSLDTPVGPVDLVGISDLDAPRDLRALQALLPSLEADSSKRTSILMYHTPDLIEAAAEGGLDFYLAGHTHGGQIRLPLYGALLTFSQFGKKYEGGAYQVGDLHGYVSRGIGMEGWMAPRVRFLCPPEIISIDIQEAP